MEGCPWHHVVRNSFLSTTFTTEGIFHVDFLENDILGFDENLPVVS